MSMKFLADNGGLQALIQAIKDQLALFDRNKQNKLVAGRGITINQSTRVISSDGEPNVQADWNMATESSASFIRNKPDIYTKREIDSMFSATITFVRVDELPATGTHGTVYLVPKQGAGTGDIYDEYLWLSASGSVEAHYELIGSTSVDLTNYYTKSQTDNLLGDKVDKESGKGLSTEDFTTAEKTKLSNIEAGAKANVQSDWNQSDSTKDDFIKNKPTLRQPATDGTSGQYLKSNGSGNAPSWETMDTAPTANSTKAVTSGGVKTALDGKQASVTITTNANTPTDNDTVIMQDNGNTGTTSFLRRKLSTLWDYIKGKADGFYVPFEWIVTNNDNFSGSGGKHLYNLKIDDGFFGANKRWSVTREIFDIESGELVTTQNVSQLFDGNFERLFTHPTEGEKEVITITPASGATSLKTYFSGKICLHFYNTKEPLSATLKISVKDTPTTFQTYSFAPYRGKIWRSENFNLAYPHTVIVEIIGKSYTGDGQWVATSLTEMSYFGTRNTIGEESALVKHEIAQEMFGNLTAPKFITKGGTSSQYLRGDGSLTTLSTSPTSGSGLPITSGGVYTALNGKQSVLTITIPDNSGYRVMQLIADVTDSFNAPNYNISGLVGYIYQWRYGGTGTIPHRITAIGGHDADNVYLYSDSDIENRTILPYLVKYDNRYYIALKKASSSRTGIRLVGYWTNILSTPINLYANSTASKWYSDSGRTTEVTFEIVKSYSRYPNAYLNFGGTSSQVVLGTGELKTIDSSVASGSSNLVTSGGVKTALDEYFPLAGKKAIAGVYKNAPSYIHNVDFGNTSTEGIWRKFCVISTRQTYRNAVGEIHVNARSTQGTIYLIIGSSATTPPEGENNTLNPSVKYLSLYNDDRPVYWRVNDDNELELWWKATQYYDSVGVTGVNFSPYFLSLGSDYNAGVNVQWTNVVSLEAPANLSQALDVSLTTLDVSAGDVLTIDGDNYKDYLRTPSDGIPTNVLEADRIVLPRAYSTIFFDTNYTATISYILGATGSNVQKNGRRLTVAGNWKPREESSGDGRFTQYLYKYRSGSVGASQFADCLREAYEDFVYFNGIWYSKGY